MKTAADFPYISITTKAAAATDAIMYIFSGQWELIDNFAPTPVWYEGFQYMTSEHAYAAAKAQHRAGHDFIAAAPDPGVAKARGRKCGLRPDWERVKFHVMHQILEAKFAQNRDALAVLQATGGRAIYEGNTWNDDIWGVVLKDGMWWGQNALGVLLMEQRRKYFGR